MTLLEDLEAANDALSGLMLDDLRDRLREHAKRLREEMEIASHGGSAKRALERINGGPAKLEGP